MKENQEKKYMYQIQYIGMCSYTNVKTIFKPVYVYLSPQLVKQDYEYSDLLTEFSKQYYKHMYNIEVKSFKNITSRRRKLDKDKLDYVVYFQPDKKLKSRKRVRIYNEYEQLWLEDEVPKLYNQEYGEFKIDVVKWFYDTKVREVPFRPAKELNNLECEELVNIFETLQDRENYVLIRRYFRNKDFTTRTYKDIGEELGVTANRVRDIELRAIKKLRHPSRLRRFEYVFSSNKQDLEKDYVEKQTLSKGINFNYNDVITFASKEIPLEDLDLSVRAYNCLKRAGIKVSGDLIDKDMYELAKIRNLGKKSLKEVLDVRADLFRDTGVEQDAVYQYSYSSFKDLMYDLCRALEQNDEINIKVTKKNNIEIDNKDYMKNHRLFNFTIKTYNKENEY